MRKFVLAAALALTPAVFAATAADAAPAYARTAVNMRAGPGTDYPRIDVLRTGQRVELHGCLEGWSWCDVSIRGNRGWVSAAYLNASYQNRRMALRQVGPRINTPFISFTFGNYWDTNYRNRPFYRERARWQSRWDNDRVLNRGGPRGDGRRGDNDRWDNDRRDNDRRDNDRRDNDRGGRNESNQNPFDGNRGPGR